MNDKLGHWIREIPDFPMEGILFKDITPLLSNADAFSEAVTQLADLLPAGVTHLAGIESRGFIFASALAARCHLGLVLIRKQGKLPGETLSCSYALEYGEAVLEMQHDALKAGDRVVLVDDLLATGGTAAAAVRLITQLGAELLGITFLIELDFLKGRESLQVSCPIHSLIHY